MKEKGTDESLAEGQEVGLITYERSEGVQGVLTLFCSGAAQVCRDDRVVELKEQLEVEEEDRGQTGGRGRSSKGETSQRGAPMNMTVDDCECAQNLSHESVRCHHKLWNKDACSLSACTPRVR